MPYARALLALAADGFAGGLGPLSPSRPFPSLTSPCVIFAACGAGCVPVRSTQDISKLTNAQKNLLIWEQAEKPDYQVGIAVSLRCVRHGCCSEMR